VSPREDRYTNTEADAAAYARYYFGRDDDDEPMARCLLCWDWMPAYDLLTHLHLFHPDVDIDDPEGP
jgi:hypothetical protein